MRSESWGRILIEVEQLRFSYKDDFSLNIPRFALAAGKRMMLQGASGSGKTTFLMLLRGILKPNYGSVCVLGRELTGLSERERRMLRLQEIGSIFQFPALLPYLTVEENLNLNHFLGHCERLNVRDHPLVEKMGMTPYLSTYPSSLSGGQIQRISLIRPFLHAPRLIIADEPTNHLDSHLREVFMQLLEDYRSPDRSVLLVSHDASLAARCDQVVEFSELIA